LVHQSRVFTGQLIHQQVAHLAEESPRDFKVWSRIFVKVLLNVIWWICGMMSSAKKCSLIKEGGSSATQ
jgi:hypothetical protein